MAHASLNAGTLSFARLEKMTAGSAGGHQVTHRRRDGHDITGRAGFGDAAGLVASAGSEEWVRSS